MCGGGSSNSNGTTNQTMTATTSGSTTPNTPDWLAQPWQDYAKGITGLPDYTVNGPSALQTKAFGDASSLGESPYFSQAGGLLGGMGSTAYNGYNPASMTAAHVGPVTDASATSAAGGIGTYMNPFTSTVAGNTLNELERAREMTQANNGQGAVLSGQFGGSRQGVLDANTNRDFFTTAGNTLGNLNLQGYQTAVDAANNDANRSTGVSLANAGAANTANLTQAGLSQEANTNNQNADNNAWQYNSGVYNAGNQFNTQTGLAKAGLLGNLGTAAGTQQLQQLGLLGDMGSTQYQIGQNQANAPYVGAGMTGSLLSQIPSNLFVGQNTTNNSTGTSNGTTTGHTSTSPGLFDWMKLIGSNFSNAASAAGGGGG